MLLIVHRVRQVILATLVLGLSTIRQLAIEGIDMRLALLGNCSCRALGFSPGGVSRVFPLVLLLMGSVLMSSVPAHAGIIDAIMGGGTVIGKECVNAKVFELGADFGSRSINLLRAGSMTRISQHLGGYYFA